MNGNFHPGGTMRNIRFLPSLYTSENLKELTKKKWFIQHGLPVKHCYAITISKQEHTVLDIMTIEELHKKFRRKESYDIIGLASSRHGAFRLLERIYADAYANTGAYDVKSYFTSLME